MALANNNPATDLVSTESITHFLQPVTKYPGRYFGCWIYDTPPRWVDTRAVAQQRPSPFAAGTPALLARLITQRVELNGELSLEEARSMIEEAKEFADLLDDCYEGVDAYVGCTLGQFVELPSTEVGFERVRGERSCQGMRVVGVQWFDDEDLAT